MKPNPKVVTKFHVGLLVISLTITSIMLAIYFRISHLKTQRINLMNDFEDDDDDFIMFYEYMGDKVAQDLKNIDDAEHLKKKIRKHNKEQLIHNQYEHVVLQPPSSVIVIQVHQRVDIEFLKSLLNDLKLSAAISKSLLIFSHDYYDDEINTIIKETRFRRYIQIYYPYSTQLFPDSFPGPDQQLCTNDFQCERSALRYELFSQKKHFWWWQMNYVFDELNVTKAYNSAVIFIEADQFVLKDFIFMAKIMELMMQKGCPECEILCLGAHAPELTNYHVSNVSIIISSWSLGIASTGIAFNRTVWNSIKNYSSLFCNHNDYRWDASLRHLGLNRDRGQFIIFSVDAPRIMKYRKCDSYVECSPELKIEEAEKFAKTVHRALFPQHLFIKTARIRNILGNKEKEIGGWEDDRDRGLCMYLVKS